MGKPSADPPVTGAMLLAVLFGQLTRRVPNADGGLYVYARHEFGDFAGYLTALPGRLPGADPSCWPASSFTLSSTPAGSVSARSPEPADNPPDGTAAPAPADTQRERAAG